MRALGFKHVYHLPKATEIQLFKRIESEEALTEYRGDFSFWGCSNYSSCAKFEEFLKGVWDLNLQDIIKETINLQKTNPELDIFDVLEIVQNSLCAWLPFTSEEEKRVFGRELESYIGAVREKELIKQIIPFGLHLYGNKEWSGFSGDQVRLSGKMEYQELPKLYNASKINLNITCIQNKTSLDQRIFDIGGCGGFVLTDYRPDLGKMFVIGKEVVFYKDIDDLNKKVEYFLDHPDKREEMAFFIQKRVQREHTYLARMEYLIKVVRGVFS